MTLTKERLEQYAYDDRMCNINDEIREMARMALAGMEAEHKDKAPELSQVIYHFRDWNEGFPVERFKADYVISWMLANYPPAPQPLTTSERAELENYRNAQQVVPDELANKSFEYIANKFQASMSDAQWILVGWNAFRSAMLQGKSDGNSPVITDGWVMVPVEPTEEMLDEFDSIIDYGAEDSKDAWSRLISAAPQQEVKSALEHGMQRYAGAMQKLSEGDK